MAAIICGTGSFIPPCTMENQELAGLVDTSDQWIRERTGIERRHIARAETAVSMAAAAGRRALELAGMAPEEVELIIVATFSTELLLPCTACAVQQELGAENAVCFDLNGACTGFLLACSTAAAYLAAGVRKTALVIGSECLSRVVNWKDRGTCILFGDGAGAAVLKSMPGETYLPAVHSDGSRGEALTCRSRHDGWRYGGKNFFFQSNRNRENALQTIVQEDEDVLRTDNDQEEEVFLRMDGHEVFKFAVRRVPEVIREVLEKNHLEQKDISWYLLHQANQRIVESIAKRLEEPLEKFPMNLQEYGNTSAASIPILLDEMNRSGKLKKGQRILLAGFGAGLTWGASVLEWQMTTG